MRNARPWPPIEVSRSTLYVMFLGGALIGFATYRWGHYFWPDLFTLVGG